MSLPPLQSLAMLILSANADNDACAQQLPPVDKYGLEKFERSIL